MLTKNNFRKSRNKLEGVSPAGKEIDPHASTTEVSPCLRCKKCDEILFRSELPNTDYVCPKCGYHMRVSARRRIAFTCDKASFVELNAHLISKDPLNFPNYNTKLSASRLQSKEKDAVITGTASICSIPCAIFVMDAAFMMGSMGSVVGEKITRLFEHATKEKLPVIGFTLSGGARMQEGTYSLMQMAKTSGAVKYHSDAGLLYITVLTDPTTGGVTASFAMEGDIILAEPKALIAFAGPRVIEQTIRQKLPKGFQSSEFLLEHGFIDAIVPRAEMVYTLAELLAMHSDAHFKSDDNKQFPFEEINIIGMADGPTNIVLTSICNAAKTKPKTPTKSKAKNKAKNNITQKNSTVKAAHKEG